MNEVKIYTSLNEIKASSWNKLAGIQEPFCRHEFLLALERSNSIGERTGWKPFYITLENKGSIEACTFCYEKNNSYGEYIFDWSWAAAYQQCALPYYPKLVTAVPFTPASCSKLLISDSVNYDEAAGKLLDIMFKLVAKNDYSSIHHLFILKREIPAYEKKNMVIRHSVQFEWKNRGYKSFEDFLVSLKRKKRREIQRERDHVHKTEGLTFKVISGDELTIEYAKLMYDIYLETIDKKFSSDYLTEEFFIEIFTTMKDYIILFSALKDDKIIALALNFLGGGTLFGRYWGTFEYVKNLHFELCYYQAIDYAIANELKKIEAGAQGGHKIQRGYSPCLQYSAHWLEDERLMNAVTTFVEEEKKHIEQLLDAENHSFAYKEPLKIV